MIVQVLSTLANNTQKWPVTCWTALAVFECQGIEGAEETQLK
jgi:hypothetical protein